MGTLPGGNGGEQPPNGGSSDGVPELPPDWGFIVIPDDAAELDDEAALVRRQLRRKARQTRWRRRLHLPPRPPHDDASPSLGVPLAIMSIAVIATLISLFAVAWPGRPYQPTSRPSGVNANGRPLTLPDLVLVDETGVPVRIRETTPAVVLLVDGCDCERLVADTASVVDPRISVLVVSAGPRSSSPGAGASASAGALPAQPTQTAAPTPPRAGPTRLAPPGVRVRALLDPTSALRSAVPGVPVEADRGTVLLVDADWAVVRVVPHPGSVADLKPDLERLAG